MRCVCPRNYVFLVDAFVDADVYGGVDNVVTPSWYLAVLYETGEAGRPVHNSREAETPPAKNAIL
jgi:hypothetical protein